MLPGRSGLEICPFLRQMTDAPILFLTAKTTDYDKLTGFAVGGDDYVVKPFNPLEVVARIKSLLRRYLPRQTEAERLPQEGIYDFGRFQVMEPAGELRVEGELVYCPALVYQLLLFFANIRIVSLPSQNYMSGYGDRRPFRMTTPLWYIFTGFASVLRLIPPRLSCW